MPFTRSFSSVLRIAALTALVASLAGCGMFNRGTPEEREARRQAELQEARETGNVPINIFQSRVGDCPAVSILADAELLTKFAGGGRDLTNVAYEAEMLGVDTRCTYGREFARRYGYSEVEVDMEVNLGSTAVPRTYAIPYFIAVINPSTQQVVAREVYSIEAEFTPNRHTVRLHDEIDQIRIPVIENADALAYEIVVGFELTPEEVDFNRSRRN